MDIRKFFDTIDHGHLRGFLKRRIRDGVLLRLIGKWLNASVLDDGCITYPDEGSPQEGVVSPMLSNVFLHYVPDEWFEKDGQPLPERRGFRDPLCGTDLCARQCVFEMGVGPSEPACGGGLQTTLSGLGKEPGRERQGKGTVLPCLVRIGKANASGHGGSVESVWTTSKPGKNRCSG